jgi:hypothetical protein
MYGPIKKLINHTSRLLTWTAWRDEGMWG